jgi:hypothetical protein
LVELVETTPPLRDGRCATSSGSRPPARWSSLSRPPAPGRACRAPPAGRLSGSTVLSGTVRSFLADTRPLQDRHFRRLWLANIVTVVGAQLTVVAVPAQVYAITGSSAYVGLTGVFGLVPLVVFGLWGGALADVFDRRSILVVTTVGLIVTSVIVSTR